MKDQSIDNLVRMANQIATALGHEDDPVAATATHIRQFWTPAMIRDLAAAAPAALHEPVRKALALL